jgi:RNA polymerase sigma-70 factor (ECF subfamily)
MTGDELARRMYFEGRSKWERLTIVFTVFERYFEGAIGAQAEHDILANAADFYLCCACASTQSEACELIERQARDVLIGAIGRVNSDPEFIQDTLQAFWERLLADNAARLVGYSARGPLNAWLRVSASRFAVDRLRAERRHVHYRSELLEAITEGGSGPESKLLRARFAGGFRSALARAFKGLSPRDRNVLRLSIGGQLSVDGIGRAYGVHRATAARWLVQAKTKVFEFVQSELAGENAKLTETEMNQIAHLMGQELDFSLSQGTEAGLGVQESHHEP